MSDSSAKSLLTATAKQNITKLSVLVFPVMFTMSVCKIIITNVNTVCLHHYQKRCDDRWTYLLDHCSAL